jgi:hypothetical protein
MVELSMLIWIPLSRTSLKERKRAGKQWQDGNTTETEIRSWQNAGSGMPKKRSESGGPSLMVETI